MTFIQKRLYYICSSKGIKDIQLSLTSYEAELESVLGLIKGIKMVFNTEFEITLPTSEKEEDYYSNVQHNIGKFLGKVPKAYIESMTIKYLPGQGHNLVSFSWPESVINSNDAFQSNQIRDEKLNDASKKVGYWFRHSKFFKKHGVRNLVTYVGRK